MIQRCLLLVQSEIWKVESSRSRGAGMTCLFQIDELTTPRETGFGLRRWGWPRFSKALQCYEKVKSISLFYDSLSSITHLRCPHWVVQESIMDFFEGKVVSWQYIELFSDIILTIFPDSHYWCSKWDGLCNGEVIGIARRHHLSCRCEQGWSGICYERIMRWLC